MITKLKTLINKLNKIIKRKENIELLWAEYFKLSIADKPWLKSLALHPGRWAGNFTFFFLLNRVLTIQKPINILELGMGESTKFINSFLQNILLSSNLTVVEHNREWIDFFMKENNLCKRVDIQNLDLTNKNYRGSLVPGYQLDQFNINNNTSNQPYDLVVVDGPYGSNNKYSRIDILEMIIIDPNKFNDTVFIFDDTNRKGEYNTLKKLIELKQDYFSKNYNGIKSCGIAVPKKLKFLLSL